ncbi:MAG TPA: preprotein translocase subunit SecY [Clostridiaceae bacterium]|nr:preprotein translocase subunit SecY [Clostridiaceae bacterium]
MGSMLETLRNALKIQDLRKRLIFTLIAMLIYRLGTAIPVPGISVQAFTEFFNRLGQYGGFMETITGITLTGETVRAIPIFILGIQPYINSSIIMQLLTAAIPALERLSKEGEAGRKKLQKITRFVTVGLALIMSFAYWSSSRSAEATVLPPAINALVVIFSFTAGSAFIMWLGEQINERGIGNGISMIIFTGIISRFPMNIQAIYFTFMQWSQRNIILAILGVILVMIVFVAIITLVVYIQSAERRIPVQYAKKVIGRKMYGGQSTYLPIKVNQSGVLPVIFAVSVLMLPSTLISLFGFQGKVAQWFLNFSSNPLYYVLYALFILAFTFFYSSISFNPIEMANNLQKNGGFIPGIRPGRPTSTFIGKTSKRLLWFEALFLVFIVLFPSLLSLLTNSMQNIWFGGTSVLIVVGVAMDMITQLESQLMMRHYKGFLD